MSGIYMSQQHPVTTWISQRKSYLQTILISMLAFLTYACMYGIRKPFTAAEFQGITLAGFDYKTLLILSQVVGYALSKFIGIRVISAMERQSRALSIIILSEIAELSLILFGLVPPPYNFILLFFNGLPLGMIWGLVFAYLEGRRTTEILGTVLSISFIVSSGFVKTIGKLLMGYFHLSEFNMPWVTGLIFFIPMILLVSLLDKVPEPTHLDQAQRTKRIPMDRAMRKKVFQEFAPGLALLTAAYVLLTIYRDLRDNFAVEIWNSAGMSGNAMIFTWSELPVALLVAFAMGSLILINDNKKALRMNHYFVLAGFSLIGLSTLALRLSMISPVMWMILLGLGTYLGYLPFNSILFDRLIAAYGSAANAGFFIYVADSFGYLGSVSAMLIKSYNQAEVSWFSVIRDTSYGLASGGIMIMLVSLWYFNAKSQIAKSPQQL
jgi:MFS family permease